MFHSDADRGDRHHAPSEPQRCQRSCRDRKSKRPGAVRAASRSRRRESGKRQPTDRTPPLASRLRVAETIAKARALRDLTNVSMVAIEELGGQDQHAPPQPPAARDLVAGGAAHPTFRVPRTRSDAPCGAKRRRWAMTDGRSGRTSPNASAASWSPSKQQSTSTSPQRG